MKKFFYVVTAVSAVCVMLLASCKKNEQPQEPAKDPVTVSLVSDDELKPVELTHNETGVSGDAGFTFKAVLDEAAQGDVTVSFSATFDMELKDEVSVSPVEVTIKAGETESEEVTVSVTDFKFLEGDKAETEYDLTVSIDEVTGAAEADDDNGSLTLKVTKLAYSETPEPEDIIVTFVTEDPMRYELTHQSDGLITGGPIAFSFKATLESALEEDVTLPLTVECTALTEENATEMEVSATEVTIKAGETESEEVTVNLENVQVFATTDREKSFSILVAVDTDQLEGFANNSQSFLVIIDKSAKAAKPAVSLAQSGELNFYLTHTMEDEIVLEGESSSISYKVKAVLSAELDKDVVVTLAAGCKKSVASEGTQVSEDFDLGDKVSFSSNTVTIPEGALESEEVTVTVSDPTVFKTGDELAVYTLSTTISECTSDTQILYEWSETPAAINITKRARETADPEGPSVVSLKTLGGSSSLTFNLDHAVDGTVSTSNFLNFQVVLSHPAEQDITVKLGTEQTGGYNVPVVLTLNGRELTDNTVTIPAGAVKCGYWASAKQFVEQCIKLEVKSSDGSDPWEALKTHSEAIDFEIKVNITESTAEISEVGKDDLNPSSFTVNVKKPAQSQGEKVYVSGPANKTVELVHGPDGVDGNGTFTFTVRTDNILETYTEVNYKVESDLIPAENIWASPNPAEVRGFSDSSGDVQVGIDLTVLEQYAEEKTFTVTVTLTSSSWGTYIDPDRSSFTMTFHKSAKTEDEPLFPAFGDGFITRGFASSFSGYTGESSNNNWTFNFWTTNGNDIVENADKNALIGNGTADVATDNDLINFTVDFGEKKTIKGVYTQHWNIGYFPTYVRLSVSADGDEWIPMQGSVNQTSYMWYFLFREEVTTQYLKYEMLTAPSRVDITEFKIYKK